MIFNVPGHIKLIIDGKKTETRRSSNKYKVGKTYSIQLKRTSKGITEGRILITDFKTEKRNIDTPISWLEVQYEGNYTPEEYEKLYNKLNPKWKIRYAYRFKFIPALKPNPMEPVIRNIRRTQTDIIFTMPKTNKNKETNKNE